MKEDRCVDGKADSDGSPTASQNELARIIGKMRACMETNRAKSVCLSYSDARFLIAEIESPRVPSLFHRGHFELHGGGRSFFKIDCDALSNTDIDTLAQMAVREVSVGFGSVEGVSRGGLRLAEALRPLATIGPVLIVDDVLTTGGSMEAQRNSREALGLVIFARGPTPQWVRALFSLGGRLWV